MTRRRKTLTPDGPRELMTAALRPIEDHGRFAVWRMALNRLMRASDRLALVQTLPCNNRTRIDARAEFWRAKRAYDKITAEIGC